MRQYVAALKCLYFSALHKRHFWLYRGNTARKQELVKELQRNGVNFDVRKLNVGDFLWVAREKVSPVPGKLSCLAQSPFHTHFDPKVFILFASLSLLRIRDVLC